jgi:hypothetical protein
MIPMPFDSCNCVFSCMILQQRFHPQGFLDFVSKETSPKILDVALCCPEELQRTNVYNLKLFAGLDLKLAYLKHDVSTL